MMLGYPPPPWNCFKLEQFRLSCWLVASIAAALGLASQTVLADNECGPVPASGGTIVCNAESYDPAADGNIVYRLGWDGSQAIPEPNDYTIEFRGLKGEKGIVINDGDAPHDYFPSRPNGVWIEHHGPGNLSALISGIELTTTEEDAGTANARGFNLTLYAGSADISLTRRDLFLKAENSIFNTWARALTGVHVGTGDVNIDATNLQITTTGPSGHGIVGWHDANGNVNVNVKRSNIVAEQGYGVSGFVWNAAKFNRIPDPGDKTLSLRVSDSQIRGHHGLYARHQGSGKIDLLLSNSSIATERTNAYGIFALHTVHTSTADAPDNLDISINVANSQVTTANAHGILAYRQLNSNSTGTNRITVGPNSQIKAGGTGIGILTQGKSVVTIEGQVIAESGLAVANQLGDLEIVLLGNPYVEGRIQNLAAGHMTNVYVSGGRKLVDNGQIVQRIGPTSGAYDMIVSASDGGGFQIDRQFGPRAFVYESLPEMLHTLNRLSTRQERGRAASLAEPFWMRVEGGRATREPTDSTTGTDWQMERSALLAGYVFSVGAGLEAGVSAHYGDASTDISGASDLGGGEIDTESYGLGASLTWRLEKGIYFDAQGAANWYDSDLSGTARGTLKSGVGGTGWALALEIGRRLEMTQLAITPHARVVYSEIDADSFVDKFGARVSSDTDDRTMGGVGVTFEGSRGWVLAELQREFGIGTNVDVTGMSLDQRMARARARIAMGGSVSVLNDKLTLRGEFGAASDLSSSAKDTEVKAGITAHMSF